MTEPTLTTELEEVSLGDASGFGGHPKGCCYPDSIDAEDEEVDGNN